MNAQLYLYDVTYILADGRILERYGLVAAEDMPSALLKLTAHYKDLNSIGIIQLGIGPREIGEETWANLSDDF